MDDLFLLKLALEKLNDKIDKFEAENKELIDRVYEIERQLSQKVELKLDMRKGEFEDKLLDTKQVRKYLGISHNTLQAIVNTGKLIQKRINGHNVRYLKSNIMAYIKSLE